MAHKLCVKKMTLTIIKDNKQGGSKPPTGVDAIGLRLIEEFQGIKGVLTNMYDLMRADVCCPSLSFTPAG